ncbi:MAG: hypothetical protein RHS_5260 [Robinsoniella sp. RHS]|nr:MAG: hypothetical protein RHS_5260 [Robinsoniella sp. RHS]
MRNPHVTKRLTDYKRLKCYLPLTVPLGSAGIHQNIHYKFRRILLTCFCKELPGICPAHPPQAAWNNLTIIRFYIIDLIAKHQGTSKIICHNFNIASGKRFAVMIDQTILIRLLFGIYILCIYTYCIFQYTIGIIQAAVCMGSGTQSVIDTLLFQRI